MNIFKSLTAIAVTTLSSGALRAHEVEINKGTKVNYVSHDEVRQEFEAFLREKKADEIKAQKVANEERQEELRRDRFFNRTSRER